MSANNVELTNRDKWTDMLERAVKEPGLILKAYTAFHAYSTGNQLAALLQCRFRGIEPGPIDTYKGWQEKGRQVRKGAKAIMLCMPLTRKRKCSEDSDEEEDTITFFAWKPNWFVITQTEGEPVTVPDVPDWNQAQALAALSVQEIQFTRTDGNVQGYAAGRQIAISPIAELPAKTLAHELAHVVLGHTEESSISDSEQTPKNLREVEAEAVALLVCESLGLPGAEYCRGYIQGWLNGEVIPEKSAQRILGAADRILRAGRL
jgi:hypothetical protein